MFHDLFDAIMSRRLDLPGDGQASFRPRREAMVSRQFICGARRTDAENISHIHVIADCSRTR